MQVIVKEITIKDIEIEIKRKKRKVRATTEVVQKKGIEREADREIGTEGDVRVDLEVVGVGLGVGVGPEIGTRGLRAREELIEVVPGTRRVDRQAIAHMIVEVESGREVDQRRGGIPEVIQRIGVIDELRAERKAVK